MSDSTRHRRIAAKLIGVFAVLVAAAVCVAVVLYGRGKQVEYNWEADRRHQEYTRNNEYQARDACLVLPLVHQANCIAEARHKARENERQEQDLVAQRVTAVWTFLMGCAAILGVGLSAIGVFLVFTTFKATREGVESAKASADAALDQARDLQLQQLRPYIHFESGSFKISVSDKSEFTCSSVITIKNSGLTPAAIKRWALFFYPVTNHTESRGQSSAERPRMILGRDKTDTLEHGNGPGPITPYVGETSVVTIIICVKVLYSMLGDDREIDEETWLAVAQGLKPGETREGTHWVLIPEPDPKKFGLHVFSREWVAADG
ncbi:hypothetical protein [Mesorhizobium sp. IMUNJ 23232]|uniref:hypothetical protein n=1 Tax=Mesorhizobium sp. IMUNJ 23232 TaxID=3376064 RepID=UPI0037A830AD